MTVKPGEWGKLSRLLDEALDLEPALRLDWIASLAPEYESIRATLRDLLLQQSGIETVDLLSRIPGLMNSDSHESLVAGELVGPYRLIRELGVGGMGSVWLAQRADGSLQRQVALKMPRLAWIDRGLIARMVRERDILSALEHPHIARLYDAGVDAQGRPYLALEYIEGVPLDVYSRERALTLRHGLELFLKIARAVAFAHARLIVHRDLKPTNILVKSDGDVRLLDFGIAHLLQNKSETGEHHTQLGGRALTPRYAAPEQFTHQPITVATDVYSLGVLLYELLTGISPYVPKRESDIALEDSVLNDDPPLPSTTKPSVSRALRGDLDGILLKALKKAPIDRYASVEAFAADIERFLAGQPVDARPDSNVYRFGKFVSRHKLQVSAATAVVLALTIGLGTALWQARVAAGERDRAFSLVTRNAAVNNFMGTLITDTAESDKPVRVNEMLARGEQLVLADTTVGREDRAAVLAAIAARYQTLGDTEKSARLLKNALALIENTSDRELRSQLTCAHALAIADLGQADAAINAIARELENLQGNTEDAAMCLLYRSYIAIDVQDSEGALRYATQALERYRSARRTTSINEGLYLGAVAAGYRISGDNRLANEYYNQALQKFTKLGRETSLDAMSVRSSWAIVSSSAGVPMRALELYDQTLRILTKREPEGLPTAALFSNRATALESIGRYAEAGESFERGRQVAHQKKYLLAEAVSLLGLASIAEKLGNRAAATRYVSQTIGLVNSLSSGGEGFDLSRLALVQGKLDLADGNLEKAREHFESVLKKRHINPTAINAELGEAEVNLRADDATAAAADARAALRMATSLQGGVQYSNHSGLSWLMLGRALQARGETAEAQKAFEAAVTHLSNTVDANHPSLLRARELLALIG